MTLPCSNEDEIEALSNKVNLLESILNDSNQLVQMSYLDDMTMVYVNETAKRFRGGNENHAGRHCYEYMMGLEEQCPFCPLLQQNGQVSACKEVDNGTQVFSVKTTLTQWHGRDAFIEYAADVTPSRRAQQGFEMQMRTLINSIPEAQGIMHFDLTDNVCISVNGSATNNLKTVKENVPVNVTLEQTFSFIPDDQARAETFKTFNRDALIAAYENGTVELSREVQSYFDDGTIRWARITARIILNPQSDHIESILYGMDISEEIEQRQAFEQETHQHLALFNTLAKDYLNVYLIQPKTDSIRVLKLDGYMTAGLSQDRSAEYPYSRIYEQYIVDRVHPDDQNSLRKAMSLPMVMDELAKYPEYIGTYRILEDGQTHFYQFKYRLADNNEGVVAGFQNIDSTIATEREQQDLLKMALTAAEEANEAKSAFLSSMSHDIRTPLNAIIGFNNLATEHLDDRKALEHYLENVRVSSNHLLDLINDVLDMSHIESGKIEVNEQPMHLLHMFDDLRTIIGGSADAAGLDLVFDTSNIIHENVLADELKLKKVLVNILGNAVKFTDAGGTVTFRAKEKQLRSSDYAHFIFSVTDTGIGMSEDFQKHVFEAFAREHEQTSEAASGTGLGLSIAKSLVNYMNGTIHVESAPGKGSTFVVTIHLRVIDEPLDKEWEARHSSLSEHSRDASFLRGKKVLLVEDNDLNREISAEILKAAGLSVSTAPDGAIAVDIIEASDPQAFDIVLMDIQMPNMNGYEATRAIRKLSDPRRASVPIIAVTANAFSNDRDEALAAGMDGHIAKPIDIGMLMDKMSEIAL